MPATYRQVECDGDPVQDFVPVDDTSLPAICVGLDVAIREDFIVHPRGRGGFVYISVQKMEPEIVIRAIEKAIGQPVTLAVSQAVED